MPRLPKPIKRANSRPQKPIDWEKVDRLLRAGCNGTEIAPHFNIHPDTLYIRVEEQYGMTFTDYQSSKRSEGDSLLRDKQQEKALDGDNTLLIFLGKVRLNQRETQEHAFSSETMQEFKGAMAWINEMQSKNIDNK